MRQLTFTLIFSFFSIFSFAQWQYNGNDTYYNDGKVGIGTNTPEHGLHLKFLNANIMFEDTDANAGDKYSIINNTNGGDDLQNFGIYNSTKGRSELSFDGEGNVSVLNGDMFVGKTHNNGVILTSPNGTKFKITVDDSGNFTTVEFTGIIAVLTETDVDVYPNPSREILNISIADPNIINVDAEIYNLFGKMIFMKNFNSNSFKINISDLANGTYIFKLKDKEGILLESKKFVKL